MSEARAPATEGRPATASSPRAMSRPGGLVGGRYRVSSVIGEGAQSIVYLACCEGDPAAEGAQPASGSTRVAPGTEIALKVIHRHLCGDPQIFRRFHREAAILGSLEGEHVVKLLDFVEDDGLLAIALERVDGVSLEGLLAEHAPLDLDVAIEITLQVCAALGAAHANGIVHRDLKTANVLIECLGHDGGASPRPALSAAGIRVKVVDFGLGKVIHGEMTTGLTEQGMIFGTPEYMAPEQARGDDVDARADLYAAGVMLYEMVVGAPPFSGRNALDTMSAHLVEPPRSPRAALPGGSITPSLEAVMLRALAKDPADRYESARELAQAIAAARDQPRVFAPHAVANPDEIAAGDTDLHLEPAALAQARTLRADELAAMQNSVPAARLNPSGQSPTSAVPSTLPTGTAPPAGSPRVELVSVHPPKPKAPLARPEILDETTAVSGEPRRRMGLIWAIVAIVAAAVGVVIGVIVGTR